MVCVECGVEGEIRIGAAELQNAESEWVCFFLEVGVVYLTVVWARGCGLCVFFSFLCWVTTTARGKNRESRAMPPTPPLTEATVYSAGQSESSDTAALVQGSFRYFHYLCDTFDDRGWGCGWRTVQTILSWLKPEDETPSIPSLQRLVGHDVGASSWMPSLPCRSKHRDR